MAAHPYTQRVNQGGNFCGHYPFAPKLELTAPIKHPQDPAFKKLRENAWANEGKNQPKGGIPLTIARLIERIPQYYARPRKVLPSLDLANNSDRQQRSERREACIVVLGSILKYTELASLRVGIPTAKGFVSLTVRQLAKHTHLGIKRYERAIADLKLAGIITVSQPRQLLSDGRWVGLAAVKAVNKALFEAFGLGSMLKKERDKAAKRLKRKSEEWQKDQDGKPSRTGRARMSLFISGKTTDKPKQPVNSPPSQHDEDRRRKLIMNLAVKFHLEHPDWTPTQCNQEAEKEIDNRSAPKGAQATH